MKIEYRTPSPDNMTVVVETTPKLIDNQGPSDGAVCVFTPEPVAGTKTIPVGRFRAIGNSGRTEDAEVLFDLRRGQFVIQPKKLESEGFDFDKPVESVPAQGPRSCDDKPAQGPQNCDDKQSAVTVAAATKAHIPQPAR